MLTHFMAAALHAAVVFLLKALYTHDQYILMHDNASVQDQGALMKSVVI